MFGCIVTIIAVSLIKTVKKEQSLTDFLKGNIPFAITLVSVLINLVVWVLPCSASLGHLEREYWEKIGFPLIPTSLDDIKLLFKVVIYMAAPLTYVGAGAVALALAFSLFLIDKNGKKILLDKNMLGIYVALTVGLVASYLGYMPMIGRIWVFLYPLIMLSVAYVSENLPGLFQSKGMKTFAMTAISLVCIADFAYLVHQKQFVWSGQQLSASVEYLNAHKAADDFIYVEMSAIPQYSYLINYEYKFDYFPAQTEVRGHTIFTARIEKTTGTAPYAYDSIVLEDRFENSVQAITEHDSVWILFAHRTPNEEKNNAQWQLLVTLRDYGDVALMNEYAGTPLYKFTKH
jgi:hypothetical protein